MEPGEGLGQALPGHPRRTRGSGELDWSRCAIEAERRCQVLDEVHAAVGVSDTLQLLAALAVPFFFRRITHSEGAMRTVVAPALATLLLGAALCLVIAHIDLLTGASDTVNLVLLLLIPAVFAAGLGYALRIRSRRPHIYAAFAADPAEDVGVRAGIENTEAATSVLPTAP